MIKKLAIVGYGNIARKHIEVFRALGCEIVASCNRSALKRDKAKTEAGIKAVFSDVHEMVRTVQPDGILVCVSFWNMFDVLKELIPYGIPILSEKPTGTSLEEHLALASLSKKYNTPVMVGFNRRHYSVLQNALNVAGGKDNITSILIEWSEDPLRLLDQKGYTPQQVMQNIFGNSIHGLDLLTYLAGDITEPTISFQDLGSRFRWIMNLSGISERGIFVQFHSNWDNFIPWRVVITTPGHRFIMAPLERCMQFIGKSKSPVEMAISPEDERFKAGFYHQAEIFLKQQFNALDYGLESATSAMTLADKISSRIASKTLI